VLLIGGSLYLFKYHEVIPNRIIPTPLWKAYDNDALGVTAKYPPTWKAEETNSNPLTVKIASGKDDNTIIISAVDQSSSGETFELTQGGNGGYISSSWKLNPDTQKYEKLVVYTKADTPHSVTLVAKNENAQKEIDAVANTFQFPDSVVHEKKIVQGSEKKQPVGPEIDRASWAQFINEDAGIHFKYPQRLDSISVGNNKVNIYGKLEGDFEGVTIQTFDNEIALNLVLNDPTELLKRDVTEIHSKIIINNIEGQHIERTTAVGTTQIVVLQKSEKWYLFTTSNMSRETTNTILNSITISE
jgi:hypothetical protein